MQTLEQPSLFRLLPSSHCSGGSLSLFPQTIEQTEKYLPA